MTGKIFLNTGTAILAEVFSNSKVYEVPPFQRDYSWSEEEWDDLWYDILALNGELSHYMGYLVLQQKDTDRYIIIDGQQRLATFSIIALAVIKNIDDLIQKGVEQDDNNQRKSELWNRFLGYRDPVSLISSSKLFLNRNNNDFYQIYVLQLREPPRGSRLKPSEKLLSEALQYFYKKIKSHFGDNVCGAELAKFLDVIIAKNLVFTTIYVSDETNAYKVFETLNARGVKLSTSDLLKNYLFSIASQRGDVLLEHIERQWLRINQTLVSIDFPIFLRHFWNSRYSVVRKTELFKEIKKKIITPEDAKQLLENLDECAAIYVAFSNPSNEIWNEEQRKSIVELELFNVTQCYPLLLSGYFRLNEREFIKLLKICSVISFRYNVIGDLNPNKLEEEYSRTAVKIYKGELKTPNEIFNEIKSIYIEDEKFINDFSNKMLNSTRYKKLIRYILFSIENQIASSDYYFEDAKVTIEHILPKNPTQDWEAYFSYEDREYFMYRLGNFTLLEVEKNSECDNKSYNVKKQIYQSSNFQISNKLSIYDDWSPNTLRDRQRKLAKIASSIWKISY